jgi:riboflavin transporter FmnP
MKSPLLRHTATYGLYVGLALIVHSLLSYLLFDQQNKAFGYLSYLILIAGIVWATVQYRDKEKGGFLSYGDSVGYGVLLSLFYGIISALFAVILVTLIDPQFTERIMDITRETLYEDGRLTEEQIEMSIAMAEKFSTPPFILIFGVIVSVIVGLIISLITSIFTRRNKPFFNE